MTRLPAKSKGPIRVRALPDRSRADNRGSASVDEWAQPEALFQLDARPVPAKAPLLRLLRFPDVRERTGLSRSTIWRLEQRGAFPKHRRISANVVAWVEAEIERWIESKVGEIAV